MRSTDSVVDRNNMESTVIFVLFSVIYANKGNPENNLFLKKK